MSKFATILGTPDIFRRGRARAGWCCQTCHREYPHGGAHIRTFSRLAWHTFSAHRRPPQSSPSTGCAMHGDYVWHQTSPYTFTANITWRES